MRVNLILEQRFFHTADGAAYANAQATYHHWLRYLAVFEEVRVIARSELVAAPPSGYQPLDGPGIRFLPVPPYQGPFGLLRRLPAVLRQLAEIRDEEAVIVQLSGLLGHLTAGQRSLRRRPFGVMVVNDPYLGYAPHGSGPRRALQGLIRTTLTALTRGQCRQAAAVQYVTRSALQRRYPASPGRPQFGVSDIDLRPEAYAPEPRVYTGAARRAVMVGNLHLPHKGVDLALQALAKLREEGLDLRLQVIGEGGLRSSLEAQARELGVAGACTFVGARATPAQVREDLRQADLFLIPSRTEGLPRALLEGLAQALPAIGADVGGIPELLSPDALFPAGDAAALARQWRRWATDPARLTAQSAEHLNVARSYANGVLDREREAFLWALRRVSAQTSS